MNRFAYDLDHGVTKLDAAERENQRLDEEDRRLDEIVAQSFHRAGRLEYDMAQMAADRESNVSPLDVEYSTEDIV